VGLEALNAGGSAVDAALTQSLVESVLNGGCCTSFAGVLGLLYYEAATGQVHWLDAGWNTVLGEDEPETIQRGEPSGRSAFVPGYMAGVEEAHARFGRLPFAALFEPAIYFAENGFEVGPNLAAFIKMREPVLSRLPETRAVFSKEDGSLLTEGDRFIQPALARTLRGVAQEGADYMYGGPWAEKLVEIVQREGGKMTLDDLARYEAVWRRPLSGTYGDYEIHTPDPSILRLLFVAEAADIGELPHLSRSAEALSRMTRIYSLSALANWPDSAVQEELPGFDLSRSAPPPSKEIARALWEYIRSEDWPIRAGVDVEPAHSASVVAVDAEGNIAVVLHTINTVFWGTTGIFVDGVSISDIGSIWGPFWSLLDIKPGERLPGHAPLLIATQDGVPALASGAVNNTMLATFQAVVSVLDHGMTPGEAGSVPFFYGPVGPMTEEPSWAYFRTVGLPTVGFPDEVVDGMKERGFAIREIPLPPASGLSALSWIGVSYDPGQGLYRGGTTQACCGGWAIGR
jgi:gamma-glutamyltranspeptidase/glutathione hydrolase